jgi:hypothetical protein
MTLKPLAFLLLAFLPLLVKLQNIPGFNTFIWTQLDRSGIDIYELDLSPVPLVPSTETTPRQHNIAFDAVFRRDTSGDILVDLAIKACLPRGPLCVPVPWYRLYKDDHLMEIN